MSESLEHPKSPYEFLIRTDEEGRVVSISDNCYSYFAVEEKNLEGLLLSETSLDNCVPGLSCSVKSTEESPHVVYTETAVYKEGKKHWISWTHTAFIQDGKIASVVSYGRDITAEKDAHIHIERDRERHKQIIKATDLATWEWNVQTNEVWLNDRWANILGYELEELHPTTIKTWTTLAHPEDIVTSDELIQEVMDGQTAYYEHEIRMRHKEGHWVWVMDRGALIERDEDGRPLIMAGTHTDITLRKNQEQQMLKRLEFMDLVADMSVKLNRADSDESFRETLSLLIRKMGEFFEMCRAYLFEFSSDLSSMSMTHEWVRDGVTTEIHNETLRYTDDFKWWMKRVKTGEILSISDVSKMPDEASMERSIFNSQDIKALISVPTVGRYGTISGILGFDKTDTVWHWPDDQQLMMRIFAEIIGNVLERRRMEAELKESEERFSSAFSMSPVGLAIYGPDHTYVEVNNRYADLHGYEAHEMIDKSSVELNLLKPEQFTALNELLSRNNLNVSGYELNISMPDGKEKVIEIFISPISIKEITHLLISAIDVTEKKQSVATLKQRDTILSAVGVAANHMLQGKKRGSMQTLLEELGKAAEASRAYIFDVSKNKNNVHLASQIHEWCAEGIIPQIDNPELQNARLEDLGFTRWKEVLSKGELISGDVTAFPDDEQEFLQSQGIESILVLPIFVDHQWWGFIGFDQCDAQRRWSRTEIEALETSAKMIGSAIQRNNTEKQLQLQSAALDSAANAIYITNVNGELEWINPAWSMLTGYSADEALGKKTSILRSGIHDKYFYENLWNTLTSGDVWSGELVNKKKNGELYYEMQTITPLLNDDDDITHFIGFKQDITEQKKAEREIKRSLREKKALLAEIHHRVKNNLAVVSGVMQLQAGVSQNDETKNELMNSVTRIKTIANVHELLYKSENFTSINFSDNITKLQSYLMDTMGGQTNVSHHLNCDDILLSVTQAMPASLILNEVLTNAYKHAFKDRGEGEIRIEVKWKDPLVHIRITDNGTGIGEQGEIKSASLGLQLIDILCEQLEATYAYRDTGDGTLFEMQFGMETEAAVSFGAT